MPHLPTAAGALGAAAPADAPARSRFNEDISFAFRVWPRLDAAGAEALRRADETTPADGRGFTDAFADALSRATDEILAEAPSPEAGILAERLSEGVRRHAADRAMSAEADRRGAFFRESLEGVIETARARVVGDPDTAEETYDELLGALSLAGEGWLGRATAASLAENLRGELFETAARGLIARDPERAGADLETGRFADKLAADKRAQLSDAARTRAGALAADRRSTEVRAARAQAVAERAERHRVFSELAASIERGEAGRADLVEGAEQLGAAERALLAELIEDRERAEAERVESIARVEDFLARGDAGPAVVPAVDTGVLAPSGGVPGQADIDSWWEEVFRPAVDRLDGEERAAVEDQMVARLGAVPRAVTMEARAALYDTDPPTIVAAGRRIAALSRAVGPEGAPFTPRERAVAERLTAAADEMPTPGLALRKLAAEMGVPAAGEKGLAEILLPVEEAKDAEFGANMEDIRSAAQPDSVDAARAEPDGDSDIDPVTAEDIADRDDSDEAADSELARLRRPDIHATVVVEELIDSDQPEAERREFAEIYGLDPDKVELMRAIVRAETEEEKADLAARIDRASRVGWLNTFEWRGYLFSLEEAKNERQRRNSLRPLFHQALYELKGRAKRTQDWFPFLPFSIFPRGRRLGAAERKLLKLHGKPAPKRKDTKEEIERANRVQREIDELRAQRDALPKGSKEAAKIEKKRKAKQLEKNKGTSGSFERVIREFLRSLGFEISVKKKTLKAGGKKTVPDDVIRAEGRTVGYGEVKSGKARDKGKQREIQEKAADEEGVMRMGVEEGGKFTVTRAPDPQRGKPRIGVIPVPLPNGDNDDE